jgi:hypothetical protein
LKNSGNRVHVLPVTNRRVARKRNKNGGAAPTDTQRRWLSCGMDQAGGKLPLFDDQGQRFNEKTIRSCLTKGWAEPWFENPLMPDWLVCRLTEAGRVALRGE